MGSIHKKLGIIIVASFGQFLIVPCANADANLKSPSYLSCREYLQFATNTQTIPGMVSENAANLSAYNAWGVGYVQAKDPTIFPAIVRKEGRVISSSEEMAVYVGIMNGFFGNICRKNGDLKLEELARMFVERIPATLK